MDRLAPAGIEQAYGQPDRALSCGASTVWIYDADVLWRGLVRASPLMAPVFATAPAGF